MRHTTIRQALRLSLPLGTRVITGRAYLENRVLWALSMAAAPPFFGALHGEELLLLSLPTIHRLDNEFIFTRMIADMVALGITGIAYEGVADNEALCIADKHSLPLLQLPEGANLEQAAQSAQRLITQKSIQETVRAQELARYLSDTGERYTDSESFLALLTQLTGHAAILQDQQKNVLISPPADRIPCPKKAVRRWIRDGIAQWKSSRSLQPVYKAIAGTPDWAGWQAPVTVGEHIVTVVSLADKRSALDTFSQLVVSQAALAWSQRLDRERSVTLARSNVREEFIRRLVQRPHAGQPVTVRLAHLLGYDLEDEQQAMVFAAAAGHNFLESQWQRIEQTALRCAEKIGVGVLSGCVNKRLILLGHAAETPGITAIRQLADEVRGSAVRNMATPLFCGIGRSATGLEGLYRSLQQAEEAVDWGRRLFSSAGGVLAQSDVAMYRLLYALRGSQEAYNFYQATLGPLADYDHKQGTELLPSLETYLRYHGNVSQAAKALHVHRNTLIYRLKRIAEISGLDLDEAETRLSLQLSLRLSHLL